MIPGLPSLDIHQVIVELLDRGRPLAAALVLRTEGSTPAKAGARCLFDSNRLVHGTIGGGLVEAEAQRIAFQTISLGKPVVFDFACHGNKIESGIPVCGGKMRVLVDPNVSLYRQACLAAVSARQQRQHGLLLTSIVHHNPPNVAVHFLAQNEISTTALFPGPADLLSVFRHETAKWFETPSTVSSPAREVLVEPQIPWPVALIIGGGHIGQAVAAMASQVGFDIAVVEDRPEFARPELFPDGASLYCAPLAEAISQITIDSSTYIAIVTRGPGQDAQALMACIGKSAAYIGLIGSRRKIGLLRRELMASGEFTSEELDRIYAPIGLDIGAITVPEIAVSIVSQLIAVRRKAPLSVPGKRRPEAVT